MHTASDHDWETCSICLQQAVEHGILEDARGPIEDTYEIVRFRFKGEQEIIKTGLTLEEAQEHCNREDTHGEGWFDGFRKE